MGVDGLDQMYVSTTNIKWDQAPRTPQRSFQITAIDIPHKALLVNEFIIIGWSVEYIFG